MISALSVKVQRKEALQVALSHLFFNLIGVIIFLPFKLPLSLAKFLAEEVAVYQWFGVVYILGCFLVIPLLCILTALYSEGLYWILFCAFFSIFFTVSLITRLQVKFGFLFDKCKWSLLALQKWKVSSHFSGNLELFTALVPQLGAI